MVTLKKLIEGMIDKGLTKKQIADQTLLQIEKVEKYIIAYEKRLNKKLEDEEKEKNRIRMQLLKERKDKAGKLFLQGFSIAEVARMLDVNRKTVNAWHQPYSTQKNKIYDTQIRNTILIMRNNGETKAEIGRKLQIPHQTVGRIVKEELAKQIV